MTTYISQKRGTHKKCVVLRPWNVFHFNQLNYSITQFTTLNQHFVATCKYTLPNKRACNKFLQTDHFIGVFRTLSPSRMEHFAKIVDRFSRQLFSQMFYIKFLGRFWIRLCIYHFRCETCNKMVEIEVKYTFRVHFLKRFF